MNALSMGGKSGEPYPPGEGKSDETSPLRDGNIISLCHCDLCLKAGL